MYERKCRNSCWMCTFRWIHTSEPVPAVAKAEYTPGRVMGPNLRIWGFSALLKATSTVSRLCPVSSPATCGPTNFSPHSDRDRATTVPLDIECFKSHTSMFFYTEEMIKANWIVKKKVMCPSDVVLKSNIIVLPCLSMCVADTATPSGLNTVQWECAPAQCVPSWNWTLVLCGKQHDGLL